MENKSKNDDEKELYKKYVAAWICPKCGTTHPITVQNCCINSNYKIPYKPLDYPNIPHNPDWQWPRWICKI